MRAQPTHLALRLALRAPLATVLFALLGAVSLAQSPYPSAVPVEPHTGGGQWANGAGEAPNDPDEWQWQLLPDSLIYSSYLAGVKEPRFASVWAHERDEGWIWDISLGGRVGIARYGTLDDEMPDGWQIDLEGAAFPRLDLEEQEDLIATDYRFGLPMSWGLGAYRSKFGFYHISAHIGDEYLENNPGFTRLNYSRNSLVWGHSIYCTPDTRVYAEVAWSFETDVAEPWEYQFGVDFSPVCCDCISSPFAAINTHLREEVGFGGNLVVQAGWQWRRGGQGRLFRAGIEYYDGKSEQFEFFDQYEQKIGLGLWYDY
jgi:hypothetical protein